MKSVPDKKYQKEYSETGFWIKLKRNAGRIGRNVIVPALELYVVLKKGKLKTGEKLLIIAALGYFISPLDAIPDLTPFIGYSDDLAVLLTVTHRIFKSIPADQREKIKHAAEEKTRKLFGEKR